MKGVQSLEALAKVQPSQYADLEINSEDQKALQDMVKDLRNNRSISPVSSDSIRSSTRPQTANVIHSSSVRTPSASTSGLTRSGLNAYGVPISTSSSRANVYEKENTEPAEKIKVCVRKRPLNSKEIQRQEKDIAEVMSSKTVVINEPKQKVDLTKYVERHLFVFDHVFDETMTNEEIYKETCFPLVESIFQGARATCFAYGQTGSGKTFTMLDPLHGLYMLASRDIFRFLRDQRYQSLSAFVSFYEIYQGQLYDLLSDRKKLFAREDGNNNIVIAGITEVLVSSAQDLMNIFGKGSSERSTGQTGANDESSRSHAILQICLKGVKGKILGKFSFIDLAGSERGADRGETDQRTRMEGSEINKSLLALKECIRALDQDSRHTPFRQSKLTQVLKDSFVGNSRTCMIATISPNSGNSEHTLNTLRYADRVKELKGDQIKNENTLSSSQPNLYSSMKRNESLMDEDFPFIGPEVSLSPPKKKSDYPPQFENESVSVSSKQKKQSILTNLNSPSKSNLEKRVSKDPSSEAIKRRPSSSLGFISSSGIPRPNSTLTTVSSKDISGEVKKLGLKQQDSAPIDVNVKRTNVPKMTEVSPKVEIANTLRLSETYDFQIMFKQYIRESTELSKLDMHLLAQLYSAGFKPVTDQNLVMQHIEQENDEVSAELHQEFLSFLFEADRQLDKRYREITTLRHKIKSLLK